MDDYLREFIGICISEIGKGLTDDDLDYALSKTRNLKELVEALKGEREI